MADALQLLMVGVVFCLMLGLGSTVKPSDVTGLRHNPKPAAIGFISQFIFMPLMAFCLAKILDVPDTMGLSMILIGCTPGGSTSNLFTYFSRGDVGLSIAMTL
jgi:predicted Na+-dependent transporter